MTSGAENGGSSKKLWAVGFGTVWIAGIFATLLTFGLTISGTLWDLGFPLWLIDLSDLVGVWQWMWIAPVLAYAPPSNRRRLYDGLRLGGISFCIFQVSLCAVIYLFFRHFSLQ
jgi:hypothetical protein